GLESGAGAGGQAESWSERGPLFLASFSRSVNARGLGPLLAAYSGEPRARPGARGSRVSGKLGRGPRVRGPGTRRNWAGTAPEQLQVWFFSIIRGGAIRERIKPNQGLIRSSRNGATHESGIELADPTRKRPRSFSSNTRANKREGLGPAGVAPGADSVPRATASAVPRRGAAESGSA